MKTLITSLFILITFQCYSQNKDNVSPVDNKKYRFTATDSTITNQENKTVFLYGNVDFETDKLKVQADKVFFDKNTNQITAIGYKKYSFSEKVTITGSGKNKILRYTIGDDTVLLSN